MDQGNRKDLCPLLKKYCRSFGLDSFLVEAIIEIESGWNAWAVRYEETSPYLVVPTKFANLNKISIASERICQKMSWGLMQILGSTARFCGYSGPLTALCDPDRGMNWGCKYLQKIYQEHALTNDIIASYNAGSPKKKEDGTYKNQEYVDKVQKMIANIKAREL